MIIELGLASEATKGTIQQGVVELESGIDCRLLGFQFSDNNSVAGCAS